MKSQVLLLIIVVLSIMTANVYGANCDETTIYNDYDTQCSCDTDIVAGDCPPAIGTVSWTNKYKCVNPGTSGVCTLISACNSTTGAVAHADQQNTGGQCLCGTATCSDTEIYCDAASNTCSASIIVPDCIADHVYAKVPDANAMTCKCDTDAVVADTPGAVNDKSYKCDAISTSGAPVELSQLACTNGDGTTTNTGGDCLCGHTLCTAAEVKCLAAIHTCSATALYLACTVDTVYSPAAAPTCACDTDAGALDCPADNSSPYICSAVSTGGTCGAAAAACGQTDGVQSFSAGACHCGTSLCAASTTHCLSATNTCATAAILTDCVASTYYVGTASPSCRCDNDATAHDCPGTNTAKYYTCTTVSQSGLCANSGKAVCGNTDGTTANAGGDCVCGTTLCTAAQNKCTVSGGSGTCSHIDCILNQVYTGAADPICRCDTSNGTTLNCPSAVDTSKVYACTNLSGDACPEDTTADCTDTALGAVNTVPCLCGNMLCQSGETYCRSSDNTCSATASVPCIASTYYAGAAASTCQCDSAGSAADCPGSTLTAFYSCSAIASAARCDAATEIACVNTAGTADNTVACFCGTSTIAKCTTAQSRCTVTTGTGVCTVPVCGAATVWHTATSAPFCRCAAGAGVADCPTAAATAGAYYNCVTNVCTISTDTICTVVDSATANAAACHCGNKKCAANDFCLASSNTCNATTIEPACDATKYYVGAGTMTCRCDTLLAAKDCPSTVTTSYYNCTPADGATCAVSGKSACLNTTGTTVNTDGDCICTDVLCTATQTYCNAGTCGTTAATTTTTSGVMLVCQISVLLLSFIMVLF